jgi:hypothetical protein
MVTQSLANMGSRKPITHYLEAQQIAQFMQVLQVKLKEDKEIVNNISKST